MLKIVLLVLLTLSTASAQDSTIAGLDHSLTPLIQRYFPDAEIKQTAASYIAKHGTMQFTLHGSSKGGEIFAQTYQEEGPNYKGFILDIALRDGRYQGAATVPQHSRQPYWTTFIDGPAVSGQDKYLWIRFSYGSRLNPDFQKALLAALPKSLP